MTDAETLHVDRPVAGVVVATLNRPHRMNMEVFAPVVARLAGT